MNNKLKVLILVIAMSFMMVGCGGGGSSSLSNPPSASIDNSTLADGENQYGYFGADVIFVNTKVTQNWSYFNKDNDDKLELYSGFYADGDGYFGNVNQIGHADIDYGVSKDGKVIKVGGDYSVTITLVSILYEQMTYTNTDTGATTVVDCYNVTASDRTGSHDVMMCPDIQI